MLKLFDNNSLSRGKDFQLADSVDKIATAIWDMFFPALEWGMKIRYPYTYIFSNWEILNCIPQDLMGQLNVLQHYGYPLSMYDTQICFFKHIHCISLHCLLQGEESSGNSQIRKPVGVWNFLISCRATVPSLQCLFFLEGRPDGFGPSFSFSLYFPLSIFLLFSSASLSSILHSFPSLYLGCTSSCLCIQSLWPFSMLSSLFTQITTILNLNWVRDIHYGIHMMLCCEPDVTS